MECVTHTFRADQLQKLPHSARLSREQHPLQLCYFLDRWFENCDGIESGFECVLREIHGMSCVSWKIWPQETPFHLSKVSLSFAALLPMDFSVPQSCAVCCDPSFAALPHQDARLRKPPIRRGAEE